jgi:hypothetical protein
MLSPNKLITSAVMTLILAIAKTKATRKMILRVAFFFDAVSEQHVRYWLLSCAISD